MSEDNLPRNPGPPVGDASIKFPGQRWDPATGDTRVFQSAGDVPEGWIDRYPTPKEMSAAPKPSAPAPAVPLTRAQIVDYLKAGSVPYAGNSGTKALYDLLVASLVEALAALPTPVIAPADADVTALLALFPAE